MTIDDIKQKANQSLYYILIGILSFVILVFLPMLGSDVVAGWVFPTSMAGWCIWILTRVLVSIVNVMLFHCFICQAKLNVKDNAKYKEAKEILTQYKEKKVTPRSPKIYMKYQYGRKGLFLCISSLVSAFTLTQAILDFDWIAMLSYLFVLVMGIIFGLIQMKNTELYWTEEYYEYAIYVKTQRENEKSMEMVETKHTEQVNDNICTDSRNNILDTSVVTSIAISDNRGDLVTGDINNSNSVLGSTIESSNTTTDRIYPSSEENINKEILE